MRILILSLCLCSLAVLAAQPENSEKDVLQVIDRFFVAMQARDGETIGKLLTEEGELIGYRREGGELKIGRLAHADYAAGISNGSSKLLERIWTPIVHIDGDLASAWTPYDFYVDGEFHHCGVNSFNLIRTEAGWRIAAVVYSMETENCPTSPLGPPEAD